MLSSPQVSQRERATLVEKALERQGIQRRWLRGPDGVSGPQDLSWRERISLAAGVFKLRIVGLLVFASLGGAFLGARGLPPLFNLATLVIAGAAAAAGASALNQYLERERDASMRRTRNRPLVRGTFEKPGWVLWAGLGLVIIPAALVAAWNPELAAFLVAGALIYVGVYTLWLKPRTALNIVIGGAAGSAAVMSGGAAVGAWQSPGVIALALLLFLWTPAHFWALSLLYRDDYRRGDFPMLPAQLAPEHASTWILIHSAATVLAGLVLGSLPNLGWVYILPTSAVSVWFLQKNLSLARNPGPKQASAVFVASNLYLLTLLVAILGQGLVATLG